MNRHEYELLDSIYNHLHNVKVAQKFIKENFDLDSTYDENKLELHIKPTSVNEPIDLAAAEKYVNENLDCVNVLFDFE